ncbi:DUF1631 family protein [Bacterioplanoides sp. SCSIO 12839]|uniref:DUF1631 family protein n=1 Tax=Bacterioplanoides sp. SCSIO 12839 TaxID=2829569 RepID=UPI00210582AF|nr:DUF1631 family protein [Bacterioplanoides sp. SCSIO 12839]UTW48517.1 DUF1631 family protein [Bacterioplanoides sp. SCSIO 12839]
MAAEHREHPRFNSEFIAQLQLADDSWHDCTVTDYSHTGMKLAWPHGPAEVDDQQPLLLKLQLESELLEVKVLWMHQEDKEVGVKFHHPDDKIFLRLQEFNQSHKAQGGLAADKRQQFQQAFQNIANKTIDYLPKQWLPNFLESTFDQANMARNTAEQQLWLKLEKQSKQHAPEFLQVFKRTLQQQMERWQAGKPKETREQQTQTQGSENLSLVQQDDFEEWLLAKVTASHLQSRLSHVSFEVRQLLDTLSNAKTEDCFNPIGPNTVTDAFRDALEKLQLPQEARALAFDTFEQAAYQGLQNCYQEITKQIDIPMSMRYRRRSTPPSSPVVQLSSASTSSPTPNDGDMVAQAANEHQMQPQPMAVNAQSGSTLQNFQRHQQEARQAYSNIQSLLQLRYQRFEQLQHSEAVALPVAAPQTVENVLSDLASKEDNMPANIREQVEKALAEKENSLPADSRDAIETIEQVTQNLIANEQVADFVKPHIERLGWPLLRLMMKDASLLFNPEHPGRLVLNQLAKLGKLTTNGESRLSDKLNKLIEPLAANLEDDETSLDELLESLQGLVSNAERKAKQNADRVAQAAEGEHQLQKARQKIEHLIGKDSSGRTLPNCVVEWLNEGWKQLLSLLLLREGVDSKRFTGAVKLYRQVLSLFSPKNAGRKELLGRFSPMMELARNELDQLNGSLPQHQKWHDEILSAAKEHLDQGQVRETVDLPTFVAEQEEEVPEGRGTRKAQNLQVGDWLLLTRQDQAVSIVWIAPDYSKFACVNHSGMKVIDFTLAELAIAFDQNQVKRLYEQDESAVDQSVDKLVQQIYRDLSEQANIDSLTGLSNRQHFVQQLHEVFEQSSRSSTAATLCMIDIDQFKLINKSYGMEGGDACLQSLATILDDQESDSLCARIGSNEFAMLLRRTDIEQAEAIVRELKQRVEEFDIDCDDQKFRIHISVGLAEMNNDQVNAADLIEQAEAACLVAKEKGGSRIIRYQFDDASQQRQDEFMAWGNKLNQALTNNQLKVLCLPVQGIQERHKDEKQYEILVSIQDDNGEHIPPMEYLQAAENYNRMYMLDRWILEQVVQWLAHNSDTAANIDRFILRLSGHAINDEALLTYIFEQARVHDIPVDKICFELNETSAIRNLDDAADFMHEMRSLGCQFVLSDFGTGQSSFEYLKSLPVDYVKIDHSFIDNLHTSSADYALVKSIQDITHFMAKKTIAEYSSNSNVWEILKSIGIDYCVSSTEELTTLPDLAATV